MRLPNLEGYLKFPGPLPVASIRLRYVARPAAAERFVPREADSAQPRAEKDDVDNAEEARIGAFPGEEETRIPEPATEAEAGTAGQSVLPKRPGARVVAGRT